MSVGRAVPEGLQATEVRALWWQSDDDDNDRGFR